MTKILDCTIRDGGHLNGWNFSDECVKASYFAAIEAGIDYFEIGYRYKKPKSEWGKFATCDDNYLLSLFSPDKKCPVSIMINADKCTSEEFNECNPNLTPISIVRVATYPSTLDKALKLCEELKIKGYNLFLNLMAISEYKSSDFEILEKWENKNIIEAIYFADSFGAFLPDDVEKYYKKLKTLKFKNISFHAHNNLQLAFANCIKALELNLYSIDVSAFGMGRSAGNLPAEIITGYLNKNNPKYTPVPYIDLIEKFYLNMHKETPWGYGVNSLMAGLKNIHPYYINALCDNKDFSAEEIWETSDLMKKFAPISFNKESMEKILIKKY